MPSLQPIASTTTARRTTICARPTSGPTCSAAFGTRSDRRANCSARCRIRTDPRRPRPRRNRCAWATAAATRSTTISRSRPRTRTTRSGSIFRWPPARWSSSVAGPWSLAAACSSKTPIPTSPPSASRASSFGAVGRSTGRPTAATAKTRASRRSAIPTTRRSCRWPWATRRCAKRRRVACRSTSSAVRDRAVTARSPPRCSTS